MFCLKPIRFASICMLLCSLQSFAFGVDAPQIAFNLTTKTLPNGLKVIVRPDHRAPVVFSQLWYKVGSSYEENGTTGVSHALEHAMFMGTHTTSGDDFSRLLTQAGGKGINAFTSRDYTAYHVFLPKLQLPLVARLEADRMAHLNISKDAFEKERQVVIEERRMRTDDNPIAATYERFLATAFTNNPYHHPVIGWPSDLKQMTVNDLMDWYHQWYVPNNAIWVVVGDVEPDDVFKLAQQYFGPLKQRPVPVLKERKEVTSLGPKHIMVKRPAKVPWFVVGYSVPVLRSFSEETKWESAALGLLVGVLNGDSGRFTSKLVREQKIATQVSADYDPYDLHDNVLTISATPVSSGNIDVLKQAVFKELELLAKEPVSDKELERVKNQIRANEVYAMDTQEGQAYRIGVLAALGYSWDMYQENLALAASIKPEQIQQVAKKYLVENRKTIAELVPEAIHKS